jgi:hypothetical protein
MKRNNTNTICDYSNADWAGSFDRKSTTDFCTFVGGNLVTWKSKKQNVMARSSAKVEYRAMTSTVSELTWIKQVLTDLNIKIEEPMKIFVIINQRDTLHQILSFMSGPNTSKLIVTLLEKKCNQRRLRLHLLRAKINWSTSSQRDYIKHICKYFMQTRIIRYLPS